MDAEHGRDPRHAAADPAEADNAERLAAKLGAAIGTAIPYAGLDTSIEMDDIRRAYEAKNPGKVDYKQMHDQMLSFGTPAPKYVREMMGL